MTFKIYDYANQPTEVEVMEAIESIQVHVLTGDEVVRVYTRIYDPECGYVYGHEDYDSSNDRLINYDDGFYTVSGDRLREWLAWEPEGSTYSYARMEAFEED